MYNIVVCTMYIVIIYNNVVQRAMYNNLYIVQYIMCTLYTVYFSLYKVQSTMHIAQCILFMTCSMVYTEYTPGELLMYMPAFINLFILYIMYIYYIVYQFLLVENITICHFLKASRKPVLYRF